MSERCGGGSVAGGDDAAGGGDRRRQSVAVLVAQLLVVAEPGVDLWNAEALESGEADAAIGDDVGDTGCEPAVGEVILEDHEAAAGLGRALRDELLVDRLEREHVDNAHREALALELDRGIKRLGDDRAVREDRRIGALAAR